MAESIITIGCDLGDKRSTLCVLSSDGQVERPRPIETTREGFRKFFSRPPAHVVIEVGTHSRWVSALLKELGHQVTVANPRRVQLISQNESKTDQVDAELLARLGRVDVKLLKPIQHRSMEAQSDLAVAKARDALVQTRTRSVLPPEQVLLIRRAGCRRLVGETFFSACVPRCRGQCIANSVASLA